MFFLQILNLESQKSEARQNINPTVKWDGMEAANTSTGFTFSICKGLNTALSLSYFLL